MKKTIVFLLFLLVSFYVFSLDQLDVKTFFAPDEIERINKGELVPDMYIKYNSMKENSKDKITLPRTKYNDQDLSSYEIIATDKGFLPYKLTEESKLKFYNTLAAFSKLDGMVYYSRRDAKVMELVKKCYRVESLSGNKYGDKVYTKIEPKVTGMFFQEDNKFGKVFYRSDLFNDGDNFVMINTSLIPISKFIFTLNDKEQYQVSSFFIYDKAKEGFYFYSYLAMKVKVDAVLKTEAFGPTAFSNRIRASSVHLAKLLGVDWKDKYNAWPGKYDSYKKK
jgi:hypothetical protein